MRPHFRIQITRELGAGLYQIKITEAGQRVKFVFRSTAQAAFDYAMEQRAGALVEWNIGAQLDKQ